MPGKLKAVFHRCSLLKSQQQLLSFKFYEKYLKKVFLVLILHGAPASGSFWKGVHLDLFKISVVSEFIWRV